MTWIYDWYDIKSVSDLSGLFRIPLQSHQVWCVLGITCVIYSCFLYLSGWFSCSTHTFMPFDYATYFGILISHSHVILPHSQMVRVMWYAGMWFFSRSMDFRVFHAEYFLFEHVWYNSKTLISDVFVICLSHPRVWHAEHQGRGCGSLTQMCALRNSSGS